MNGADELNLVDLADLSADALKLAYRKAKVDLYYSNDPRATDLIAFENDLEARIAKLLPLLREIVLSEDEVPLPDTDELVGGFSLIGKGYTEETGHGREEAVGAERKYGSAWHSDATSGDLGGGTAEYRVLSRCSIEMHVIGALWLGTVGVKLEESLGFASRALEASGANSDGHSSSYGDRLRRNRAGDYHWYAPGSYRPYLHQYRRWQEQGYRTMGDALDRQDQIVAITADFAAFYPSSSAEFLKEQKFYEFFGIALTDQERRLTRLIIELISYWKEKTDESLRSLIGSEEIPLGLPIGFPASGLIANVSLAKLDRTIREQVNPLYYGRYVDDLVIVLRRNSGMDTQADVWNWIAARIALVEGERLERIDEPASRVRYSSDILGKTKLELAPRKSRCYFLAGETGKLVVDSLKRTAETRTSEWRALPRIPGDPEAIPATIFKAAGVDGEPADSLRAVNAVAASRAEFALRLRDFEALAKDLPDGEWTAHRAEFLRTTAAQMMSTPRALEYERYIPRVVQLATLTSDWQGLVSLLQALQNGIRILLDAGCKVRAKVNGVPIQGEQRVHRLWADDLQRMLAEAVRRSAQVGVSTDVISFLERHPRGSVPSEELSIALREGPESYASYFAADLAVIPFRSVLLPHEWRQRSAPFSRDDNSAWKQVDGPTMLHSATQSLAQLVEVESWKAHQLMTVGGFHYQTRPMSFGELTLVTRFVGAKWELNGSTSAQLPEVTWNSLVGAMNLLRGYELPSKAGRFDGASDPDGPRALHIPGAASEEFPGRVDVAPASVSTTREQLAAAIHENPDLSLARYRRLVASAQTLIGAGERADIMVYPELSVPREWFSRFAYKLQTAGTSLIAGVEYGHDKGAVQNQVWANFVHRAWGFKSSIIYVQDKQAPSRGEERNLLAEAQWSLKPTMDWTMPPILEYRGLYFSMLICSEVTNLEYRSFLSSKVDLLVIVEWNQDVKSFSSIVESSSFDMHVFVAQANNRMYGDTRIRGPYRDEWRRDIVRVSGGKHDHVVAGEVDFAALRAFQSSHDKPGGEFKTLPDGFRIAGYRDVWSGGEQLEM